MSPSHGVVASFYIISLGRLFSVLLRVLFAQCRSFSSLEALQVLRNLGAPTSSKIATVGLHFELWKRYFVKTHLNAKPPLYKKSIQWEILKGAWKILRGLWRTSEEFKVRWEGKIVTLMDCKSNCQWGYGGQLSGLQWSKKQADLECCFQFWSPHFKIYTAKTEKSPEKGNERD